MKVFKNISIGGSFGLLLVGVVMKFHPGLEIMLGWLTLVIMGGWQLYEEYLKTKAIMEQTREDSKDGVEFFPGV